MILLLGLRSVPGRVVGSENPLKTRRVPAVIEQQLCVIDGRHAEIAKYEAAVQVIRAKEW
jgi:hypothetical protein